MTLLLVRMTHFVASSSGCVHMLKKFDSFPGGFGNGRGGGESDRVLGRSNFADGDNRYRPSEGLDSAGAVDELATLLTSGRLSQEKRNLLTTVYDEHKRSEAYINVQQLIATSPEFHTNGLARSSGELRKQPEPTASADDGYKALIEIYLTGGWDSFSKCLSKQENCRMAKGQPYSYTCLRLFFLSSSRRPCPPAMRNEKCSRPNCRCSVS